MPEQSVRDKLMVLYDALAVDQSTTVKTSSIGTNHEIFLVCMGMGWKDQCVIEGDNLTLWKSRILTVGDLMRMYNA